MPATKRGVYHNLKESKYAVSNGEIAFYFSSEFKLNSFMDRYEENREKFKRRVAKLATESPLNMSTLADINLYRMTEIRGFYAELKGVEMDWQNLHRYALRKMTEKNMPVWSRIPSQKLGEFKRSTELT